MTAQIRRRCLARTFPRHRLSLLQSCLAITIGLLSFPPVVAQTMHFVGVESSLTSTALGNPQGIAVDRNNNVYIEDTNNNRILKETPNGSGGFTETIISTSQTVSPVGASIDAAGNIYVVTGSAGTLVELTPSNNGGYTSTVIASSLGPVGGVAVNAAGTALYVTYPSGNAIYQFAYISGQWVQQTTAYTNGNNVEYPFGITIDAKGYWYIVGEYIYGKSGSYNVVNNVYVHGPGFSAANYDGTDSGYDNLLYTYGIALDGSGNLFAVDYADGSIEGPGGTVLSGLQSPQSVAVDSNGVVYVANTGANTALALNPAAVNFGTVTVGSTSPAQKLAFVDDTSGTLSSTTPYQALLQGVGNQDYAVVAGTDTTCTAGASETTSGINNSQRSTCTLSVTFTPKNPGVRAGEVVLNGSSGSRILQVFISGIGTGPQIGFSPVQSTLGSGFNTPEGVAVDGSGNVYIADYGNYRVVKETYSAGAYTQSTLYTDGYYPQNSPFVYYTPYGVAVDNAGNLFVVDSDNRLLELVYTNGTYTETVVAAATGLNRPTGVAVDALANVYIADTGNGRVLKETLGASGYTQSCIGGPSGGSTSSCTNNGFSKPAGVAVDSAGNVYVADSGTGYIMKETYSGGTYTLSSLLSDSYGPTDVSVDAAGDLYVVDLANRLLKEAYSAGGYTETVLATSGTGTTQLPELNGVAVDSTGNVYFASGINSQVLLETVTTPAAVNFTTTPVGTTSPDSAESLGLFNNGNRPLTVSSVSIASPFSVSSSTCLAGLPAGGSCTLGYSYSPTQAVSSSYNSRIADNSLNASATQTVVLNGSATKGAQTITFPQPAVSGNFPAGTVVPLNATSSAGLTLQITVSVTNATGTFGAGLTENNTVVQLSGTGSGTVAITASQSGNGNYLAATSVTHSFTATISGNTAVMLTDTAIGSTLSATVNIVVTKAATLGSVTGLTQGVAGLDYGASLSGGTCTAGQALAVNQTCSVAIMFSPQFAGPRYGAVELLDGSGNVLGTTLLQANGLGPQAAFSGLPSTIGTGFTQPQDVAVDGAGNVYIADTVNNRVVKEVYANGVYTQSSTTIGSAAGSSAFSPSGIAVDGAGNLYVSDYKNNVVVKEVYSNATYTQSSITIGSGLSSPFGVAVDGEGNVYVADFGNKRVVKELFANGSYTQSSTTIGSAVGQNPFEPAGVALDAAGNLYISDYNNSVVLKELYANGTYTQSSTTIGSGLNRPQGIAVDGGGNVYIADSVNNRVVQELYANGVYTQNTVISSLTNPYGVAVDSAGNVYAAYYGTRISLNSVAAPSALTFPSTATGVTSSPMATTVTNLGNQPLIVPVPASGLDPQTAANFALETSSDTTCPVVNAGATAGQIAANTRCTLSYVFAPAQTGALTSSSVLTDNNLNVSGAFQTITLTGTATQGTQTAQTITFPQPTDAIYPGSATLTASASSGLAVTYTVSGPATLAGSTLSYTGFGTVSVTANQAGNAQYGAAPPVSISIVVKQSSQINWSPAALKIYSGVMLGAATLDATDSVPGTISYTAALLPSGSATAVSATSVLTQGSYSLTATFTPQNTTQYVVVTATLPFTVQNMNVFVANTGTGSVSSLFNNGTTQSSATSGGGIGAAVDANGFVWSYTSANRRLAKFTDAGALSATYEAGGLEGATALAIDGGSNVWIANGNGRILAVSNAGTTVSSTQGSTMVAPTGIAIDISGNIWMTNQTANTVDEVIGGAAPVSPLSTAVTTNSTGARP